MPALANQRHEKFAQRIASGMSGAAAYRTTYGARGATAEVNASKLLRNAKVRDRVADLKECSATAAILSLSEKREILAGVVRGGEADAKLSDRLRALELDAKLAGEFTEKFQHSGSIEHRHVLDEGTREKIMELRRGSLSRTIETARGVH